MEDIKINEKILNNSFIDFVIKECELNNGGLVIQMLDGLIDLAQPEHIEWVESLRNYPIKHITKEEAFSLGYEELAEWSHDDDVLILSEMGVLFNLGNSRPDRFLS